MNLSDGVKEKNSSNPVVLLNYPGVGFSIKPFMLPNGSWWAKHRDLLAFNANESPVKPLSYPRHTGAIQETFNT